MATKVETKINNRLWLARKQSGLGQKQVARLLAHKTSNQISRYERGMRLPSLKTALKLEAIYHVSVRMLFPEHFRRYQEEVQNRLQLQASASNKGEAGLDFCTFTESLEKESPSRAEIEQARKHVIKLMRKMAYL